MDMINFFDLIKMWYNEIVEWYLLQPIFAQLFIIIGIITLLALTVTLVYYIVKGIVYLGYYIIKGVYYLLKGVGFAFYKLFEGFYNLVSGKTKYQTKQKLLKNSEQTFSNEKIYETIFCSECGRKFTEKMVQQINNSKKTFCVNCGKEYRLIDAFESFTIV